MLDAKTLKHNANSPDLISKVNRQKNLLLQVRNQRKLYLEFNEINVSVNLQVKCEKPHSYFDIVSYSNQNKIVHLLVFLFFRTY